MADFMAQEMVPETYAYTNCVGLWKGKGNKLDLNMTRYIHGKDLDAKFLEALVSERMKPFITNEICHIDERCVLEVLTSFICVAEHVFVLLF